MKEVKKRITKLIMIIIIIIIIIIIDTATVEPPFNKPLLDNVDSFLFKE